MNPALLPSASDSSTEGGLECRSDQCWLSAVVKVDAVWDGNDEDFGPDLRGALSANVFWQQTICRPYHVPELVVMSERLPNL